MREAIDFKRRIRVLHVIPTLTGGGAENFLCMLAAAFDPEVIKTALMPVYPTDVPAVLTARNDIDLLHIGRRGRYDPGFLWRMIAHIRRFRPHVVHTHLHNGKYWGRIAALAACVPVIVFTEHSPLGEKCALPEVLTDKIINSATQGIVTFTARQRDLLMQYEKIPPGKITVIENGIALPPLNDAGRRISARAALGVGRDDFAAIFLGRLESVKNPALAINALGRMNAGGRRVVLFFIGAGSEETRLRTLAGDLGITDRIAFMGQRDDAIELLYGGDVLLVPSFVEGMPLAALEAMTVGLPVITAPWRGAEELFGSGRFGLVLHDWHAETAARAIESALFAPQEFVELAARAQTRARLRFDINRIAALHAAWYAQLLVRKGLRFADVQALAAR